MFYPAKEAGKDVHSRDDFFLGFVEKDCAETHPMIPHGIHGWFKLHLILAKIFRLHA